MKTLPSVLLLAFFVVTACDDPSTETQDNTAAKIHEVENRAINGEQWRITNFSHANQNQTDVFSGYIFEFDANNLLTSTNGSENLAGTWGVKSAGTKEEGTAEFENLDLTIVFSNPAPFVDLSGDWDISLPTNTTIELHRANGSIIRLEQI